MKRSLLFTLILLITFALPVVAVEEMVDAIMTHFDNPLVMGVYLGPFIIAVVGLIRRFTKADGPEVRWIVAGVSFACVVLYNLIESGMTLIDGVVAAAVGTAIAIGGHETGGKWLREMIGPLVEWIAKKVSRASASA